MEHDPLLACLSYPDMFRPVEINLVHLCTVLGAPIPLAARPERLLADDNRRMNSKAATINKSQTLSDAPRKTDLECGVGKMDIC
jgi:hypothetical protein